MNAKQANKLISRYFEGKTSVMEERRLYAFFLRDDVPQELAEYTEMFRDLAATSTTAGQRLWPWKRIAVAAVAAVAAIFAIYWGNAAMEERALERLYGGSYMIVDGKRTDDLRDMKDEIHSTLHEAAGIEHKVANLQNAAKNAEDEMIGSIADPQQRKRIEELLN